jgi:hypothetical protein
MPAAKSPRNATGPMPLLFSPLAVYGPQVSGDILIWLVPWFINEKREEHA